MTDNTKYYPQVLRDCGWICINATEPSIWHHPKTGQTQGMPNPVGVADIVLFCMKALLADGWELSEVRESPFWFDTNDEKIVDGQTLEQATVDAYIEIKRPEWEAGDE